MPDPSLNSLYRSFMMSEAAGGGQRPHLATQCVALVAGLSPVPDLAAASSKCSELRCLSPVVGSLPGLEPAENGQHRGGWCARPRVCTSLASDLVCM